jgi:hypothetical protein
MNTIQSVSVEEQPLTLFQYTLEFVAPGIVHPAAYRRTRQQNLLNLTVSGNQRRYAVPRIGTHKRACIRFQCRNEYRDVDAFLGVELLERILYVAQHLCG